MYIPPWSGKLFRFMVFKKLENAFVSQIFTMSPMQSSFPGKALSHFRQSQADENKMILDDRSYNWQGSH